MRRSGTTVRRTTPCRRPTESPCPRNPKSSPPSARGGISAEPSRSSCTTAAATSKATTSPLLKFHGTYQQDDRDARKRRDESAEKAFAFMVRVALPAGALDCGPVPRARASRRPLGQRHPAGHHPAGLPVPRRAQARPQGDHRRGQPRAHDHARRVRRRLAQRHGLLRAAGRRRPPGRARRRARHRRAAPARLAGVPRDLARRREAGLHRGGGAVLRRPSTCPGSSRPASPSRPTTAWTSGRRTWDCVAIVGRPQITGFNVLVGGGLGMTHHKADTTARLAQPLGFVTTEHAVEAVRIVAVDLPRPRQPSRPPARPAQVPARRVGHGALPGRVRSGGRRSRSRRRSTLPSLPYHDHLGRHRQPRRPLVLRRLRPERPDHRHRAASDSRRALHEIVARLRPGVRLTGQQNLLLTDLDDDGRRRRWSASSERTGSRLRRSSRPRGGSPWPAPRFPPAGSPSPSRSA